MKLTDYIVCFLEELQIDTVFGYIGGTVADLIHSICESKHVQYIQSYHEQASAFSANAYAQVTGKTGVAVSSSGPGAINLINGIANAYYDSIPCIFITGNVHSAGRRPSDKIRQNAFQETDIVEIVKSITKYSVYIKDASEIKYQMQKAFYYANEGRKGPVLIDIPYDIQRKDVDVEGMSSFCITEKRKRVSHVREVARLLKDSHRPLLLIGGGCQNAKGILKDILKKLPVPVAASMRGLDVVSHDEDIFVGFIGSYGNAWANLAVLHCDLLIVLGSRLDERQMGYDKKAFAPNAKIVQVDIDHYELGRKTDNLISIQADVNDFLNSFAKAACSGSWDKWTLLLKEWKKKYYSKFHADRQLCANAILSKISNILQEDAIITADVGQNQIMCAQSLRLCENNIFLSSSGLACMGYSLPAAIGACYASLHRQIISINGDGGIMMNMQEMQTIKREKLPIKIIILNNACLGLIRKLQENLFAGNYYASIIGYSAPDFAKVAEAFEMDYLKIEEEKDIQNCESLLSNEHPVIIDIHLPNDLSTFSEPGENIYTQVPRLSKEEADQLRKQAESI